MNRRLFVRGGLTLVGAAAGAFSGKKGVFPALVENVIEDKKSEGRNDPQSSFANASDDQIRAHVEKHMEKLDAPVTVGSAVVGAAASNGLYNVIRDRLSMKSDASTPRPEDQL